MEVMNESAGSAFLGSYFLLLTLWQENCSAFLRVMPTAKLSHWRPHLLQTPSLLWLVSVLYPLGGYFSGTEISFILFLLGFFFLQRFYREEEGREKERERKISVCGCICTPLTGDLARNSGMCPRLGIEPVTFWIAGQHSIHWATPTGSIFVSFN